MVVMSIATYERQMALLEIYQKLGESEEQAENGIPNVNGSEVFDRLRMKYGRQTI